MRLPKIYGGMFVLALTLLLLVPGVGLAAVDRIVAVVNGEVITLKQLDNRVNSLLNSRQGAGFNRGEMRKKVLDALIDQELINQAAKTKGVFVTESDVSLAMESIKKDNKLSDAQFQASLTQSGTTLQAFRDDLRIELLRNRVLGSQIMSKAVVTDNEIKTFLRGEGPDLGPLPGAAPDKRPIRMIVLPLDPKNKTQSLNEAKRIKAEIDNGLSFAAAVKKYSKGPGRDKGGDPGDGATVANLPPEAQAAFAKKPSGQPLEPLEAGNAVIILSAVGDPPAPPQAKGKDTEFTPEAKESARRQLERYKMQQRYMEWVKELKRNAIIRVNDIN